MNPLRRLVVLVLATCALSAPAFAAEFADFNQARFAAAQAEGRPILIDVAADWCPVCRAQAPIIQQEAADVGLSNLIVFRIDYDRQRDAWRALNVRRQATLIAFNGARETGRLVGVTDRRQIAALMHSATSPAQ